MVEPALTDPQQPAGQTIAAFRGKSYRVKGDVLSGLFI
jgi:hypothetical protein